MRTRHNPIFGLAFSLLLAAPASAVPFAPYVDLAGYPPPPLASWSKASGVKRITLGFVTAREATACEPTWGGYATYPASGGEPYRLADVKALRRRGGDVVVSFGGQAGTELAAVCSPDQLLAAYRSVADAYGATRLDFDIEGAGVQDTAANERRAVALAALRKQRPKLRVSFTLPVLPSGLDAASIAIVKRTRPALVNIMAMDFGDSAAPDPQGRMGAYAIKAAQATHRQLKRSYKRIAVTPMIGINDVQTEVFTLSDAHRLHRWARKHRLGGLSMWQLGRDAQCPEATTSTQLTCSGVSQARWAFSHALA